MTKTWARTQMNETKKKRTLYSKLSRWISDGFFNNMPGYGTIVTFEQRQTTTCNNFSNAANNFFLILHHEHNAKTYLPL